MPRVNVKGYGPVTFPDTMSEDDMRSAIDDLMAGKAKIAGGEAAPVSTKPSIEQPSAMGFVSNAVGSAGNAALGVMKGLQGIREGIENPSTIPHKVKRVAQGVAGRVKEYADDIHPIDALHKAGQGDILGALGTALPVGVAYRDPVGVGLDALAVSEGINAVRGAASIPRRMRTAAARKAVDFPTLGASAEVGAPAEAAPFKRPPVDTPLDVTDAGGNIIRKDQIPKLEDVMQGEFEKQQGMERPAASGQEVEHPKPVDDQPEAQQPTEAEVGSQEPDMQHLYKMFPNDPESRNLAYDIIHDHEFWSPDASLTTADKAHALINELGLTPEQVQELLGDQFGPHTDPGLAAAEDTPKTISSDDDSYGRDDPGPTIFDEMETQGRNGTINGPNDPAPDFMRDTSSDPTDFHTGAEPGSAEAKSASALHRDTAAMDSDFKRRMLDEKGFASPDILLRILSGQLIAKGLRAGAKATADSVPTLGPLARQGARGTFDITQLGRLTDLEDQR